MTTPAYKGAGQPTAAGGWLSGFTSWFGGSAPTYASKGQTLPGYLGSAGPAYKPAPTLPTVPASAVATADQCAEPERITVLIPRELIERPQE